MKQTVIAAYQKKKHSPVWDGWKFFKIVLLMMLVILVFEIARIVISSQLERVVAATWGSIDKGCWVDTLYLRQEKYLIAPVDGRLVIDIKSGERIPRDEMIGWIDTGGQFTPKTTVLSDIVVGLSKKTQAIFREEMELSMDLQRVNHDIARHEAKKVACGQIGDLEMLKQEKERILRNIQNMHSLKNDLQQQLNAKLSHIALVNAEIPGFYSLEYDGWEAKLLPRNFQGLHEGDFKRKYFLKKPGGRVKTGEIIGKMVDPFSQEIAAMIDRKTTGIPRKGDVWRFKTKDGWKSAPVDEYKSLGNGKAIVGLTTQALDAEGLRSRTGRFFLVYRRVIGVVVPSQAVLHHNGVTVVRVPHDDGYLEKVVNIVDTDGAKTVITGIDSGTMIIN